MVIHQKVGTELQIICVEYRHFSISNKNDIDNSVSIFHEKYLLDLAGTSQILLCINIPKSGNHADVMTPAYKIGHHWIGLKFELMLRYG